MSLSIDTNNYRITASRGDDHKIRFTVKNSSGVAYDVSANSFKFTVKESLDDAIADAVIQKSNPTINGIDLTSAASGIVDVNLVPADSNALAGTYYYDLQMIEGGLTYTLRQGLFQVGKNVTTAGVGPPFIGPNQIIVRSGDATSLQAALTYAAAHSTAAAPYTVWLPVGNWDCDSTLTCQSANGVRIVGQGPATQIRATKTWITNHGTGGAGVQGLLDCSNQTGDLYFSDFIINAGYGDDGTFSLQPNALSAILFDAMGGNSFFFNCDVLGLEYCIAVLTLSSTRRVDLFRSRLFSPSKIVRSASEKWHILACDLRATRTTQSVPAQTDGMNALQFLGNGEFQVWGSHLHAEDQRSPNSGGTNPVCAVLAPSVGSTSVKIVASTLHVVVANDADTANRRFGCFDFGSAAPSSCDVSLIGCDLIYESGGVMTLGIIGGITMGTAACTTSLKMSGCAIRDVGGSGGTARGPLARQGSAAVGAISNIDLGDTLFGSGGVTIPVAQSVASSSFGRVRGSATLASGVAIVKLLTDSGNTTETTAVFTSGSASVTGGSSFTTVVKAGQFVRLSTDTDFYWTRVKFVNSATTLTLEEVYPAGGGGTGTLRLGTPDTTTQPSNAYTILMTPTTAPSATDKFYVLAADKRSGVFRITSLDASSTATVDYNLRR